MLGLSRVHAAWWGPLCRRPGEVHTGLRRRGGLLLRPHHGTQKAAEQNQRCNAPLRIAWPISAEQIRREMPPLLRLAVPIVMGEVGWMSMNFVDIAMIGRVGPTALAAVSLGSAVFMVFAIVCEGMLMGTDSMVSQDFGAGRIEECFRTLWAGAQLALPLGLVCALLVAVSGWLLAPMGIAPEIVRQATPFLYAMACGLPAQMGFVAMRVFLQGTHRVKVVAFAMVSANLINLAGNYALIYGHFGRPRWVRPARESPRRWRAATWCACCWATWPGGTGASTGSAAAMRAALFRPDR